MPKLLTDKLMQLIGSLTRAEKRHFRLFAKRNQSSEDLLFLQLFDLLDKKGLYDEEYLLSKITGLKKSQLTNLKAHLMQQLLTSLRLLSQKRNEDIQIRESIDFARVLYDKGLYQQALDFLGKAKEKALANQMLALGLEILEFEKLIEGQYITHSLEGRAGELSNETEILNRHLVQTNRFSNLCILMYSLYLKNGFARNEEDSNAVKAFFYKNLPKEKIEELDFLGKVYYCQAYTWLYHICQDFLTCFRHAQRWVGLFEERPKMKVLFAPLYLKGLHNLAFSLFHNLHYTRFLGVLNQFEKFPQEVDYLHNPNVEGLYQMYRFIHQINRHYIEGTFTEATALIPALDTCLVANPFNWDNHRIMVFRYRIACIYFGAEEYENAIDYLNSIINEKVTSYRSDIQCFARILCLLAHFELGNRELVEYQIKSVYRFLLHVEEIQPVQREIFQFLKRSQKTAPSETAGEFKILLDKLLPYEKMHFESRPFLYLDIISWLEAKIEGTDIQTVIRRKFLGRNKAVVGENNRL